MRCGKSCVAVLGRRAVRIVGGSLLVTGGWEMGDGKWMGLRGVGAVSGVVAVSEDASDGIKGIGCDRCSGGCR